MLKWRPRLQTKRSLVRMGVLAQVRRTSCRPLLVVNTCIKGARVGHETQEERSEAEALLLEKEGKKGIRKL